jgi:hypothetical protein
MKLQDGMQVYSRKKYTSIDKNKLYTVSGVSQSERADFVRFLIKEKGLICLLKGCSHLDGGNWVIKRTINRKTKQNEKN